jgi:O-glycosyl hydrolase
MKRKNLATGIVFGLALVIAFIFAGCDLAGETAETVNAQEPVIVGDNLPLNMNVAAGQQIDLTIGATSPDGGTITYQWYKLEAEYDDADGELIEGEDTGTYSTPDDTEAGYLCHYFVEITNTKPNVNGRKTASVRSNYATVYTYNPANPNFPPKITQHPADVRSLAGDIPFSVIAALDEADDPDISKHKLAYQWFSSDVNSNKDRSNPITMAPSGLAAQNNANFTLPGATEGIFYVYAVVSTVVEDIYSDATPPVLTGATVQQSIASHPARVVIEAAKNPNATIAINVNRKYQYVRGFGGMDIPWDNFFNIEIDEYEKMYNPTTGLGLNMMRIMIMPENPEDNTDPEKTLDYYLGGTELAGGARPNYIEGAKIVNKYNGYLLASPWSPPPEWKSNGTKDGGGHLITTYYGAYAAYLRKYAQLMHDRGAPIYAISIQNEPNFTASYDGCEWTDIQMRDFFKTAGVGQFTGAGTVNGVVYNSPVPGWGNGAAIPRVLIMNGESANHPRINDVALDDQVSRNIIDLIGRHTYGDVLNRYAKAIDLGKEVWMTEHNMNSGSDIQYPNDSTWNYMWQFLNDVDVSIRLNDESAFIWWALKRFYSFIGEGRFGTVEGAILPRGYAISHYAKYASEMYRVQVATLPGSTAADGKTELLSTATGNFNNTGFNRDSTAAKATAFVSPDGNTISIILYTPTNTAGRAGMDMGTVKIQLPNGFTAQTATAIRSTAATKVKPEDVLLAADRNSAVVSLPPSNIVSIRFTKQQ